MYLHMLLAYGLFIVMFTTMILRNKIVECKVGEHSPECELYL